MVQGSIVSASGWRSIGNTMFVVWQLKKVTALIPEDDTKIYIRPIRFQIVIPKTIQKSACGVEIKLKHKFY